VTTSSPDLRLSVVDSLSEAELEAVRAPLRQYNHAKNGPFFIAWDLPENAARPLNILAHDAAGTVIGGLLATTQFSWLKIEIIAIAEAWRRRGVGSRVMAAAETEAARRGCRYAYLDTMDYHAPDFYRALGYQVAGRLDDWDSHGHAKYFMVKNLVAATS
jgi:ribosomal protein S18 acetylase RimI-like enzyme